MKKGIYFSIIMLLVIFANFGNAEKCNVEAAKEAEEIKFVDDVLEEEIRWKIGKEKGKIYWEDIKNIKYLVIKGGEVKSLKGVRYLKNLETIKLLGTEIDNIRELNNLKKLNDITFQRVDRKVINQIRGHRSIRGVSIINSGIKDLTPYRKLFASLPNLEYLRLDGNRICDFQALSVLAKNKHFYNLHIQKNKITDPSALFEAVRELPSKLWVSLEYNNIETLNGVRQKIPSVRELVMDNNCVTSLSGIENFTNLTGLYMSNNQIKSVDGVQYLKQLRHLCLACNKIEDLRPLTEMKPFKTLYLSENPVKDYSPIIKHWVSKKLKHWDFQPENTVLVLVNGKGISFTESPIQQGGNLYVQAKYLLKGLGYQYSYDKITGMGVGTKKSKSICFYKDQGYIEVNGKQVKMSSKCIDSEMGLLIPLQSVVKILGGKTKKKSNKRYFVTI
ncbi:MAG: leucine-rich repeat domain-containing protein [Ruminococcus flavefaciens]|nr:leucine-rich repeat domain-containing protein [Ruminococcus flavefaciens]